LFFQNFEKKKFCPMYAGKGRLFSAFACCLQSVKLPL